MFLILIIFIFTGFAIALYVNKSSDLKRFVILNLAFIVITLFFYEGLFQIKSIWGLSIEQKRIKNAIVKNIDFDERDIKEVIDSLSKTGIDVSTALSPFYLLSEYDQSNIKKKNDIGLLPLSGISNKLIITKNENGSFGSYYSDKYGFNNLNNIYKKGSADIAIVGDSWAEGWSVESNYNIASLLNNKGYRTVNLGISGNGPLFNLATIIEYAKYLKPKIILWIHCENDIFDLIKSSESNSLNKYLYFKDYSQNLINRQHEVDSLWVRYRKNNPLKNQKKRNKSFNFKDIIKLKQFRKSLNITNTSPKSYLFEDILKKSVEITSSWGGKLYFVYVPYYETLIDNVPRPYRKYILKTLNDNNIEVIDVLDILSSRSKSELKNLYPLGLPGHFSKKGYSVTTDIIYDKIRK